MQKDHTKKEELHSRREFIQKATKGILPILGAMFIPDIVLKIKAETPQFCNYGCVGACIASCYTGCKVTCSGTCSGYCLSSCVANCMDSCSMGCKNSCEKCFGFCK